MAREYSDEELMFLAVLFDQAEGDPKKAKKLAGYSDKTPVKKITDDLSDEIYEATKKYIAQSATTAAYTMGRVMTGEEPLIGLKERMAAAKDTLDRAGLVKIEKVEVTAKNPLFILPAKTDNET